MMIRRSLRLSLLLLAACSDPLAPDVERIQLSLTVSQLEMVVGDTVEIRVVGTNPTGDTLRFTTSDCGVFGIRILWGEDQVVFRHPTTCNDIAIEHALEPGDSIVETTFFDGTVTPPGPYRTLDGGVDPRLTLGPGLYTVIAGSGGPENGNVSNPVELQIRP